MHYTPNDEAAAFACNCCHILGLLASSHANVKVFDIPSIIYERSDATSSAKRCPPASAHAVEAQTKYSITRIHTVQEETCTHLCHRNSSRHPRSPPTLNCHALVTQGSTNKKPALPPHTHSSTPLSSAPMLHSYYFSKSSLARSTLEPQRSRQLSAVARIRTI